MLTANLVILNYEGRALLERFLPSWVESARMSRYPCRVTVLDNCSTDGSEVFVRERYPSVDFVRAPENKVLCSYNDFARGAAEDVLIFLNNDIETEPDFVNAIVGPFAGREDVFFVASHGDRPQVGRRWGIFSAELDYPGYEERIREEGVSFSAGIGAFDRKKFLELGGYDELYLPGRYEDVDLCYRGWKRGWVGVYAPAARKFHLGGASFEKAFSRAETQSMVFRNSILFMVKNVTSFSYRILFVLGLAARMAVSVLLWRKPFLIGFVAACKRLGAARRAAARVRGQFVLSDHEVLKKLGAV